MNASRNTYESDAAHMKLILLALGIHRVVRVVIVRVTRMNEPQCKCEWDTAHMSSHGSCSRTPDIHNWECEVLLLVLNLK